MLFAELDYVFDVLLVGDILRRLLAEMHIESRQPLPKSTEILQLAETYA